MCAPMRSRETGFLDRSPMSVGLRRTADTSEHPAGVTAPGLDP